jgi:hypothetical protein
VAETFAELYAPLLKEVFTRLARENMERGADGLTCAVEYAEQGKPDFVLAYLLLIELSEGEKRELLAHAYERRAELSEEKAESFSVRFRRPFPLVRLEAQKDRMAARSVRQGKRVRREVKIPPVS